MDVRCEQCGTIYEFDDDRVGVTGITVKCTTCEHIFKVFSKPGSTPAGAAASSEVPGGAPMAQAPRGAPVAQAPRGAAPPDEEKRWLIRKPSGEVFKFRELTTLQQWIVEQKVSREDEISRTGKVWERLGAIKELEAFFAVVDKARAAEAQAVAKTLLASEAVPPRPAPPARPPVPSKSSALAQPGVATGGAMPSGSPSPGQAAGPRPPAPSFQGLGAGPKPPPTAPAPMPPASPRPVPPKAQDVAAPVAMAPSGQARSEPSGMPATSQGVSASEPYTMGGAVDDAPSPAFEEDGLDLEAEPEIHRAAWEGRAAPRRERDDPTDLVTLEDELAPSRSSGFVKMALVILLGTATGFGGFAAWSQWDRIKAIFSGSRSPTEGAYYKSRTLFRLDTEASYRQALEHLARILGGKSVSRREKANALATQAEVNAAWAQYLRDDAEDLLKQAERSGSRGGGADVGAWRRQSAEREEQARDKAAKALQAAQQAHEIEVSLKTKRALAEASRVAKEPAEVVSGLVNDALALGSADAEVHYSYAMLAYDRGEWELATERLRRAIELSDQKTGRPFFRAQLRLARVYLERGKKTEARTVLEAITERNPGHLRASVLLERLKEEAVAPVVTPAKVDAGVPARPADGGPGMVSDPRAGASGEADADADYDVLVTRAEKLAFAGQAGPAMALYRRALVKRPSGVEALTGLGYAHLDQRRMGEAIAHFRQALGVSPGYGEALIGMAEASQRSGNLSQALHYYRTYLQNHPSGRRAILAQTNIRELEDKIGTPAVRPGPQADAGAAPPRVTEPPPTMDPERPPPRVTEPPPAMDPERPPPRVTEPPPAMDPERPPPRVTEPPPAMDVPPPMRVAEPPPSSSGGM